jgi:hypothetical protein
MGVGLRGMSYRGVGREYRGGRYIVNNGGEGGLHSINKREITINNTTAMQDGGVEAGGSVSVRIIGKLVLDLLPELLGLLCRGGGAETVCEGDQLCRRGHGVADGWFGPGRSSGLASGSCTGMPGSGGSAGTLRSD